MDRGAWQATVHGIANCWTRLSNPAQQWPQNELGRVSLGTRFQVNRFSFPSGILEALLYCLLVCFISDEKPLI